MALCVVDSLSSHHAWDNHKGLKQDIPILRRRLPSNPKIFTIGSCFALEIRWKLRERGFQVYPDYSGIRLDPSRMAAGKLPHSDNFNHYDLFNIKQCLLLAERREAHPEQILWKGGYEHLAPRYGFVPQFSNPFLRQVYGRDRPSIIDITEQICSAFADGFHSSDVFIVTLGLIEAWLDVASGWWINNPGGLRDLSLEKRIRMHQMTYEECCQSLRKIITVIRRNRHDAPIVFTVSPVFLARTFSGNAIADAAIYGKCLLRAAVASVVNADDHIFYFPSFEYIIMHSGHDVDGRHVQSSYVSNVVSTFVEAFLGG